MAQEIEAIKTLTAARDKLAEERRALAVAMALGYRRRRSDDSHTDQMREAFIGIQNTIEAIDRAIADENLVARGETASFLASTLESSPAGASQIDSRQ
jgi:hypothetical protein